MEQQPLEVGWQVSEHGWGVLRKIGRPHDFENTADDGSALNFGRDTGFCLTRLRIEDPEKRSAGSLIFGLVTN